MIAQISPEFVDACAQEICGLAGTIDDLLGDVIDTCGRTGPQAYAASVLARQIGALCDRMIREAGGCGVRGDAESWIFPKACQ